MALMASNVVHQALWVDMARIAVKLNQQEGDMVLCEGDGASKCLCHEVCYEDNNIAAHVLRRIALLCVFHLTG